eukprot:gene15698-21806_t
MRKGSRRRVAVEQAAFHDLVLLNTTDLVHAFKWAASLPVRYDFIAKTDEDSYIHPYNFQRLLSRLPRTKAYWGKANINENYRQWSKDRMDFDSTYMAGGLYVITILMAYEDWNMGWWVAIARQALYGMLPNNTNYINSEDIAPLRAEDVQAAPLSEWYNLDWDGSEEEKEINQDAKDGHPPLSTICVHNLKTMDRYHYVHDYFSSNSLVHWQLCQRTQFQGKRCKMLLVGEPWDGDVQEALADMCSVHAAACEDIGLPWGLQGGDNHTEAGHLNEHVEAI